MHQPNYTTVLVGFNPVTLARDTPIEKWHKTCRDVSGCMHVEGIACSLVPRPQSSYIHGVQSGNEINGSSTQTVGPSLILLHKNYALAIKLYAKKYSFFTLLQTFLELEQLSQKSDRAVILNPIVGPEPITGTH